MRGADSILDRIERTFYDAIPCLLLRSPFFRAMQQFEPLLAQSDPRFPSFPCVHPSRRISAIFNVICTYQVLEIRAGHLVAFSDEGADDSPDCCPVGSSLPLLTYTHTFTHIYRRGLNRDSPSSAPARSLLDPRRSSWGCNQRGSTHLTQVRRKSSSSTEVVQFYSRFLGLRGATLLRRVNKFAEQQLFGRRRCSPGRR